MATSKTVKTGNKKKTSKAEELLKSEIVENRNAPLEEEDIRQKAAQIYHERLASGENGTELSDWLQAEATLRYPDDKSSLADNQR
jgi:hypothetical protein